jgi:hypothetical protein
MQCDDQTFHFFPERTRYTTAILIANRRSSLRQNWKKKRRPMMRKKKEEKENLRSLLKSVRHVRLGLRIRQALVTAAKNTKTMTRRSKAPEVKD